MSALTFFWDCKRLNIAPQHFIDGGVIDCGTMAACNAGIQTSPQQHSNCDTVFICRLCRSPFRLSHTSDDATANYKCQEKESTRKFKTTGQMRAAARVKARIFENRERPNARAKIRGSGGNPSRSGPVNKVLPRHTMKQRQDAAIAKQSRLASSHGAGRRLCPACHSTAHGGVQEGQKIGLFGTLANPRRKIESNQNSIRHVLNGRSVACYLLHC
jgi:hypothetical protein